MSNKIVPG